MVLTLSSSWISFCFQKKKNIYICREVNQQTIIHHKHCDTICIRIVFVYATIKFCHNILKISIIKDLNKIHVLFSFVTWKSFQSPLLKNFIHFLIVFQI